uniref:Regulator of chromosome condensation protein n=1 Tax=Parastrongyloides trichosuri TaxID=131310 RepID=A0A0N4ZUZ2_PARTI
MPADFLEKCTFKLNQLIISKKISIDIGTTTKSITDDNTVFGDVILTCGTGEQIGHGSRMTTRKPRQINNIHFDKIIDISAGGVHSNVLTIDGDIYCCGINDKGTIPIKDNVDSITVFKKLIFDVEVKKYGKFINITAGASFTAALTDTGSVLIWGDLRDAGGEMNNHTLFEILRSKINVLIDSKCGPTIIKIASGENHLICLSTKGEIYTFGDLSKGQLGRVSGKNPCRKKAYYDNASGTSIKVPNIISNGKVIRFNNIFAGGFWSMAIAVNGDVYVSGLNNYDQLGFPSSIEEDYDNRIMLFRKSPIFSKKNLNILNVSGCQHLIVLYDNGEVYSIGKNIDNALGIETWKGKDDNKNWKSSKLNKIKFSNKIVGVTASMGCSIAWDENGNGWAWGADTSGQLGLGIKEDDTNKMVSKPKQILSNHLIGKKIIKVSISDNHSIFLATNIV